MTGKTVCYHHGGKSPSGIAQPQFKTGKYSKHLPTRLAARYEEAEADPDLLSLRSDIALMDARIAQLLTRVQEEQRYDAKQWAEIMAAQEQRRKLVESERRRLTDMQQMVTIERLMVFVGAVMGVLREHVRDRQQLQGIVADIDRLVESGR